MMHYRSFYLASTEVKSKHLPLCCVSAFGKSYLIDRGPRVDLMPESQLAAGAQCG